MSKAKFTKGPWEAKTDKFGGMQMGLVYIPGGGFDVSGAPDSVANANLIACAPEMYEMLEYVMGCAAMQDNQLIDANEIMELLAKARGET